MVNLAAMLIAQKLTTHLLVFCICVSSSGITLNTHTCKGKIVSWALYKEPKKCKKAAETTKIKNNSTSDSYQKTNCCKDHSKRFIISINRIENGNLYDFFSIFFPNNLFPNINSFRQISKILPTNFYRPPPLQNGSVLNFISLIQVYRL